MRLPALLLALVWTPVFGQTVPPADPATQMHKEWELGSGGSELLQKDGSVDDGRIIPYLQQLTDRFAPAKTQVRLTRSADEYAALLPNHMMMVSAGMLARVEDEAQLAGLIAHEFAHRGGACVLNPRHPASWPQDQREEEKQATARAVETLRSHRYDPASMLILLSKLQYDHPAWQAAIHSDDLTALRTQLDNEPLPPGGYLLDSSAFVAAHAALVSLLPKTPPAPALRARRN